LNLKAKLKQHWFLVALWLVVGGGALAPQVFQPVTDRIKSQTVVLIVIFLMSVTLDLSHIVAALKRPGRVLLGVALGFGLVPLWGWGAALPFWGRVPDFSVGTLIITAMPCTLASATIWTRLAGGNDALSLLCTVASNSLSFCVTPFLLMVTLGHSATLDPREMLGKLFLTILLPVMVGQGVRGIAALRQWATERKRTLSMISQMLILSMILSGIVKASLAVREQATGFAWLDFGGLVLAIALVHGLALAGCWWIAGAFRVPWADRLALTFAGSQKTLPSGLYVASEFFPGYPLAPLPILLYHSLQLFMDSWVAAQAQQRGEKSDPEGPKGKGRKEALPPALRPPDQQEFWTFAETYFGRCREQFPALRTATAKWNPEDLIPGLSDVDLRFIAADGTGPADWKRLDEIVGRVHLQLVQEHPEWLRNLEHTPGVAVTPAELLEDSLYQPETQSWSDYCGEREEWRAIDRVLKARPFGDRDESFHLKKFLNYFTPYQHGIDPAVNLGRYTPEYAVHSRLWHYFIPPAQAAACLLTRTHVRGKFEALGVLERLYPEAAILPEVRDTLARLYQVPARDDAAALSALEERLYRFLQRLFRDLAEAVTLIEMEADPNVCRERLTALGTDPLLTLFDGVRFARIRCSRYRFYLNAPVYFDSLWLTRNEFNWLRNYYTRGVFQAFLQLRLGLSAFDLEAALELVREGLGAEAAAVVRRVFHLAWQGYEKGRDREALAQVLDLFPTYYDVLEWMLAEARKPG